jgi:Holliday junction resolvase RusA-like endonuclease
MKLSQEHPENQIATQSPQMSLEESMEADPFSLFLFAMNSPETKEKYVTRLNKFFDYIAKKQYKIAVGNLLTNPRHQKIVNTRLTVLFIFFK